MLLSLENFLASAALGILSHVAYFRHGERHLFPTRYLQSLVVASICGTAAVYRIERASIWWSFLQSNLLLATYLTGLFTSLVVYRIFFHRLSKYPGPLLLSVSDLAFSLRVKNLNGYEKFTELHEKYGPIVRVGSNKLSIIHPAAPQLIYSAQSKCTKAHWYDLTYPQISMQLERDRAVHDRLRRNWSPAFSDKALRGYEERIARYQIELVNQLKAHGGQPVNFTKWATFYGWDVMGDLSFGETFNMLNSSDEHWAVKIYKEGNRVVGWWLPVWAFRLLLAIPGASKEWNKFVRFGKDRLDKRMKNEPQIPNVMSALLKPYEKNAPSPSEYDRLHGDTILIVVAGSDTTATTLAYLCRCLAQNPSVAERVREEIAGARPADGSFPQNVHLQHLPLLNAAIQETLRLYPPVPAHLLRTTPAGGIQLDADTHVPAGADVFCPQWALGRSERAYAHAAEWIPERWTSRPELVRHAEAYMSFGLGAYACIGKPLAMLSLRVTLARILLAFDIGLPTGGTPEVVGRPEEFFTLSPPAFNLVFKER